jgi:hypothetical protein
MMNDTLPDVPVTRTSKAVLMCGNKQFTRCEAPIRLELPDGQKLFFKPRTPSSPYCYGYSGYDVDRGELDKAPALEVAYARESTGDGAIRVNNREAIDANITIHNQAARVPMAVGGGKGNPSPVPGTDGTGGTGGGVYNPPRSSGCAVGGLGAGDALFGLALVVGLMMRRRR